ncbi:2-succinyl-5-enolpyruvyl-6-hydroxy-3-cyclohexene-1-carboxylic-acid synthase [Spelaeicoccus albus]|uniref:2-succinyl-5-enolpyruvyl-6-hydroxy-3-cyclohexene-1-carboxylate synthase n=1 Tax=Spelaeicoccus albus TaxID=1280376 RepID=A0A7Z0D5Q5_9MICO|nr:2-succinyl-5-enolpyruvyl-6-hydroxy-3-cyclohexene-1-carboxylic-acid synthase [Spelaeicoccus albus]NYI69372.1 2-succinyl-5-enolpyruvyl-6-hydroxy-3-cyclohexene-1-carboxylate synthase [Spelaeicoccus albus]
MNVSTLTARALVTELIRSRIRHVVLSPGSRSAPLAYALTAAADRGLIRLHVRIDERVAGFTALGLAKGELVQNALIGGDPVGEGATPSDPVAIVTTSGTAVANLHPAVLEASYGGVPLIVLSADRPAELRGTGSNQTLRAQHTLFTTDVRHAVDVPAVGQPSDVAEPAEALRTAIALARGGAGPAADGADPRPGPVHVNVSFRPPLVPDDEPYTPEQNADGPATPGSPRVRQRQTAGSETGQLRLRRGPRTVIVAGDSPNPATGRAACRLADAAGWPVLAEPTSGARRGSVDAYRLVLAESPLTERIERVVVFGHPTLSRPVNELLSRPDIEHVVVTADPRAFGAGVPGGRCVPGVTFDPGNPDASGDADAAVGESADRAWRDAWIREGARALSAVADVLDDAVELTGPAVAADVVAATGPRDVLVVGSSNPIRDVDLVMPAEERTVVASRGLAGIDGTIATASGIALALPQSRVRVLVGDLTALHDSGALMIGPLEDAPDLEIIVFNDDGGGIFATLEQGDDRLAASFERIFGTPHGARFDHLAAAYGLEYECVDLAAGLRRALGTWTWGRRRLIEVRGDRLGRRRLDRRIRARVHAALEAPARPDVPPA